MKLVKIDSSGTRYTAHTNARAYRVTIITRNYDHAVAAAGRPRAAGRLHASANHVGRAHTLSQRPPRAHGERYNIIIL